MYQFPKSREKKTPETDKTKQHGSARAKGFQRAFADFVCFHCPLVASAEAKPLRRIAIRRKKSDYEAASSAASAGGTLSISRMK